VEEDYKTIKCRLQVENLSGKTTLSVYQDFHAKIFSKNLTAVIALTVKDEIKHISEQRKFEYQINFARALLKMKHSIVLLFIRPMEIVQTMVSKLQKIFIQTIEQIRPGKNTNVITR